MKASRRIPERSIYKPWRWPFSFLSRLTRPVPPGLWIINVTFQKILRINSSMSWQVHFTSKAVGKITIGKNVWSSFAVSGGCYFQGVNGIEIGDNTLFAPGVKIISANHSVADLSVQVKGPPIVIGRNVWIGTNAVILPGVTIGDNAVIGAGSVVTKNVSSGSVVVGNPAQRIK